MFFSVYLFSWRNQSLLTNFLVERSPLDILVVKWFCPPLCSECGQRDAITFGCNDLIREDLQQLLREGAEIRCDQFSYELYRRIPLLSLTCRYLYCTLRNLAENYLLLVVLSKFINYE
jgi:hypothetical protein